MVTGALEPSIFLDSSAFPVTECFELGSGVEIDFVGVEMELSIRLSTRKSSATANCRMKRRHRSACHLTIRDMLGFLPRMNTASGGFRSKQYQTVLPIVSAGTPSIIQEPPAMMMQDEQGRIDRESVETGQSEQIAKENNERPDNRKEKTLPVRNDTLSSLQPGLVRHELRHVL